MRRGWALLVAGAMLVACGGGEAGPPPIPTVEPGGTTMEIRSAAFEQDGVVPRRHTCDGEDVSPPLQLTTIPEGAETLVVIVDDPDAPRGTWDHWVVFDLPVVAEIPEGSDGGGVPGINSWGGTGYRGPCPPSGVHRYRFTAYALDVRLGLPAGATKDEVLTAARGHVLAEAVLVGRCGR